MSDIQELAYDALFEVLLGVDIEGLEKSLPDLDYQGTVDEYLADDVGYILNNLPSNIHVRHKLKSDGWASDLYAAVRKKHPVPADETIFVVFEFAGFLGSIWDTGPGTTALRASGISVLRKGQQSGAEFYPWEMIQEVSANDEFLFLHHPDGGKTALNPDWFRFQKLDDQQRDAVIDFMSILAADAGDEWASTVIETHEQLEKAIQNGAWTTIISTAEDIEKQLSELPPLAAAGRALAHFELGETSDGEFWLGKAKSVVDQDDDESWLLLRLAEARYENQQRRPYAALWTLNDVRESHGHDVSWFKRISSEFEASARDFCNSFQSLERSSRRLIAVAEDLPERRPESFQVLLREFLPELEFPLGHPRKDEMYIEHPYMAGTYLPFTEYEHELFQDKLHELCYLLQCLGAEEIVITTDENHATALSEEISETLKGGADYKAVSAAASSETEGKQSKGKSRKAHNRIVQHLQPTRAPHVPKDLVWFPHEMTWQRIAQQRLSGDMINYEFQFTTSDVVLVRGRDRRRVEAEFSTIMLGGEGAYERQTAHAERIASDERIAVQVKFRSRLELINQTSSSSETDASPVSGGSESLTESDAEYLEFVRECIEEDGELTSRARRLLSRWASRLEVSDQRAKELEALAILGARLSDADQEYIAEVRFCLEDDGIISVDERRFLERLRQRAGIDEDRAEQLEEIVCAFD